MRTPWGCELWLRVESLRRFLAGPQAHHLEEAANRGVLGEYTAWAVVAVVLAVVSLLVPVFPGVVALVLAAVAARRVRAAPAGAVGGRGLVAVASVLSTIGVLAWVGLARWPSRSGTSRPAGTPPRPGLISSRR